MPETTPVSVHAPYEDAAIEFFRLANHALTFAEKVIETQPEAVRAELWKMHIEDMRQAREDWNRWREFWRQFRIGLGDAFKESAK